MDSPHALEASSAVVMGFPNSSQFTLPMSMADMAAASTSTRNSHRTRRAHQLTAAIRTIPVSTVGTNVAPTFTRGRGAATASSAVAGPTTRSRKRKTRTGTSTTPLPASVPSSTRRPPVSTVSTSSLSLTQKRRRPKKARVADTRKKPPPGLKKSPPVAAAAAASLKSGDDDKKSTPEAAAAVESCCICMCDVVPNDLASINSCSHQFCFGCIEKWSERENKCPLCKVRFTKIDRVNKKRKKGTKNTKKIKNRDQHSLVPGAALEGLIANLQSGSLARIIFGGFDLGSNSGPGGTTARASFATRSGPRSGHGPPVGFGGFDDSDEEDSPMAHFMRAIHGQPGANGVRLSNTVVRPVSVTARFTTTTSRSFARNAHDSTAGNNSQNPLEIDDDDEVIEID